LEVIIISGRRCDKGSTIEFALLPQEEVPMLRDLPEMDKNAIEVYPGAIWAQELQEDGDIYICK